MLFLVDDIRPVERLLDNDMDDFFVWVRARCGITGASSAGFP